MPVMLSLSRPNQRTSTTPSMTDLMARGAPKFYEGGLQTFDETPIKQWGSWEIGAFTTLGQTVSYIDLISNPPLPGHLIMQA
jgi:hypothetical protein